MTPEEKQKRNQTIKLWKILEEKRISLLDSIEEKAQKLRGLGINIDLDFLDL